MRIIHRCLTPLMVVAVFAASRRASADGGDQTSRASPRWAIGLNPLAIAIGRYGGDLEYRVSPHHALLVNAHVDYASRDLAGD